MNESSSISYVRVPSEIIRQISLLWSSSSLRIAVVKTNRGRPGGSERQLAGNVASPTTHMINFLARDEFPHTTTTPKCTTERARVLPLPRGLPPPPPLVRLAALALAARSQWRGGISCRLAVDV